MHRRSFLSLFAALPLCGWLRPAPVLLHYDYWAHWAVGPGDAYISLGNGTLDRDPPEPSCCRLIAKFSDGRRIDAFVQNPTLRELRSSQRLLGHHITPERFLAIHRRAHPVHRT